MGFEGQDFSDAVAGLSPAFVESLYAKYKADPGAIDPSWRQWFDGLDGAIRLAPK